MSFRSRLPCEVPKQSKNHCRSLIRKVILTHKSPVRLFCISTSRMEDPLSPGSRVAANLRRLRMALDQSFLGPGLEGYGIWEGNEWQTPRARRLSGHGHRVQGVSLSPAQRAVVFQARSLPARGLEIDFAQLLDLELTKDKGFPGLGTRIFFWGGGQCFNHFSARSPNSTVPQRTSS